MHKALLTILLLLLAAAPLVKTADLDELLEPIGDESGGEEDLASEGESEEELEGEDIGDDDEGKEGDGDGELEFDDDETRGFEGFGSNELDYSYDYFMNLDLLKRCKNALLENCAKHRNDMVKFINCIRVHSSTVEESCAKNVGCLTLESELCGANVVLDRNITAWGVCAEEHSDKLKKRCPPTLGCEIKTALICGGAVLESDEKGRECVKVNKKALEAACGMDDESLFAAHGDDIDAFEVVRSTALLAGDCRRDIAVLCANSTENVHGCIDKNSKDLQIACNRNSTCLTTQYQLCDFSQSLEQHGLCLQQNSQKLSDSCGKSLECEKHVLQLCGDLSEESLATCYEKNEKQFSTVCDTFADFIGSEMPGPAHGGVLKNLLENADYDETVEDLDDDSEVDESSSEENLGSEKHAVKDEL